MPGKVTCRTGKVRRKDAGKKLERSFSSLTLAGSRLRPRGSAIWHRYFFPSYAASPLKVTEHEPRSPVIVTCSQRGGQPPAAPEELGLEVTRFLGPSGSSAGSPTSLHDSSSHIFNCHRCGRRRTKMYSVPNEPDLATNATEVVLPGRGSYE